MQKKFIILANFVCLKRDTFAGETKLKFSKTCKATNIDNLEFHKNRIQKLLLAFVKCFPVGLFAKARRRLQYSNNIQITNGLKYLLQKNVNYKQLICAEFEYNRFYAKYVTV